MTVHRAAGSGYATGAEAYRRGRPSYPAATVELVRRVADGRVVVDVGAGTGAFCSLLTDLRVVAVEPVAEMIARVPRSPATSSATRRSRPELGDTDRFELEAEDPPLNWQDANTRGGEMAARLSGGEAPRDEVAPRAPEDSERSATDGMERAGDAQCVELNPTPMTRERLVDRVLSTSFIAALDEPVKQAVAAEAADLAASLPERFDYPYVTKAFVLRPR